MKYIVICYMLSMGNLVLAGEVSPYDNDEWEGEQEGGEIDSKRNAPERVFNIALGEICNPKMQDIEKEKWRCVIKCTLSDHPELLGLSVVNDKIECPLSFALRQKNISLLKSFAYAENKFFGDEEMSMKRRKEVLREAVGNYYVDGVKVLVEYTPVVTSDGYDLLSQLIVSCTASRLKSTCLTCCFRPKIDPQREQWSLAIAQLLIRYGASAQHLKGALNEYNCRGIGCSFLRECANLEHTIVTHKET